MAINLQYDWSGAVLRGSICSVLKAGCATGQVLEAGLAPAHPLPSAGSDPALPVAGRGGQKLRLRLRELTRADSRWVPAACPALEAETKRNPSVSAETGGRIRVRDEEQNPEQWISPCFPQAELKAGGSGLVLTSAD